MEPWLDDGDVRLYHGDALAVLAVLPEGSVQTCVTSPPYFALRDYGAKGQIGLEQTADEYVARLVAVFREVRRVLRPDATLWLNLGDSFAGGGYANHAINGEDWFERADLDKRRDRQQSLKKAAAAGGVKPKDLYGVPWMVAFALRADGWYLRSDIVWAKPNPMPESVTDRPTKAHEYVFLLSKGPRYFYDADAIREPHTYGGVRPANGSWALDAAGRPGADGAQHLYGHEAGRNARSVWTIATQPTPEAHFATYPEELVRRCILVGTSEAGECSVCGAPWTRQVERSENIHPGDSGRNDVQGAAQRGKRADGKAIGTVMRERFQAGREPVTTGWAPSCGCGAPARPQLVLDPFVGSGTTALVARRHSRRAIGIDLNAEYLQIAAKRTAQLSLLA